MLNVGRVALHSMLNYLMPGMYCGEPYLSYCVEFKLNHECLCLDCRTHPHEMELQEANGALCLTEALQDSEYGYFKSNILSAWAGPQHWKVKTNVKGIKRNYRHFLCLHS